MIYFRELISVLECSGAHLRAVPLLAGQWTTGKPLVFKEKTHRSILSSNFYSNLALVVTITELLFHYISFYLPALLYIQGERR